MSIIFKKFLFQAIEKCHNWWFPKHTLVELEAKHVAGCIVLAHRTDMLSLWPKQAIIAELGVENGNFSTEILKHCQPAKLHLVDIWPTQKEETTCKNTLSKFSDYEMHKMNSIDFLNRQPENSLDIVYLDTDHTFLTTQAELVAAARVVRDSGLICGHDYTSISYGGIRRYGVVEAVNQFCVAHNYSFVYLTSESTRHISFALRKIA
jgi:hypothetical protein